MKFSGSFLDLFSFLLKLTSKTFTSEFLVSKYLKELNLERVFHFAAAFVQSVEICRSKFTPLSIWKPKSVTDFADAIDLSPIFICLCLYSITMFISILIYITSTCPCNYLTGLKVQGSDCYSNICALEWEPHSKPCQTSKIDHSMRIVNGFQLLTIFAKSFILNIWPKCHSVLGKQKKSPTLLIFRILRICYTDLYTKLNPEAIILCFYCFENLRKYRTFAHSLNHSCSKSWSKPRK